jgi:uncharacterized repeat protein (TIGR01451 family)
VIKHLLNYPIARLISGVQFLAATVLVGGALQAPTLAATQLHCNAPSALGVTLTNQVTSIYSDGSSAVLNGISASLTGQVTRGGALSVHSVGIYDRNGNLIYSLGTIATAINQTFVEQGWSQDEANLVSIAAVKAFVRLPAEATYDQTIASVKAAIIQALPTRATEINSGNLDQRLALALMGLSSSSLQSIGLNTTEMQTATGTAIAVLGTTASTVRFSQMTETAFQDVIHAVPTQTALLTTANQTLTADVANIRAGKDSSLHSGDTLRFKFVLINTGSASIDVTPPTASELQQTGMVGAATVTDVSLEGAPSSSATFSLAPGQQTNLWVNTTIGAIPQNAANLMLALGSDCNGGIAQQALTLLPPNSSLPLTDPFGRITGCNGELLPDYRGIRVALYRPSAGDNTGEVQDLVRLTTTELPDNPNNAIPAGLDPNRQNSNPFFLTNSDQGRYNFLLSRAQLRPGQVYVLVVSPPSGSDYSERRIRLIIGDRTAQGVSYRATALDGRSISATDNRTAVDGVLRIDDATQVGVSLSLLDLDTSICQTESIQIVKTGDRASAAPGDIVVYRLLVRNLSTTAIERLTITDTLPLGFNFVDDSTRAEVRDRTTNLTTTRDGNTLSFQLNDPLPQGATLSIAYAAQLTPDALRGNGQNSAIARGRRDDNDWVVRDGPAVHRLRVQAGILTDCGTILGRVFVDKNFDGEQQPGEPGVPNAVIYMDDGNRITTDANGLFSVANVLPGYRTGALDLTSLPGYTLAPNRRFIERNSPSRLVHLEPGGMVRMNFGVTPTSQEEAGQ